VAPVSYVARDPSIGANSAPYSLHRRPVLFDLLTGVAEHSVGLRDPVDGDSMLDRVSRSAATASRRVYRGHLNTKGAAIGKRKSEDGISYASPVACRSSSGTCESLKHVILPGRIGSMNLYDVWQRRGIDQTIFSGSSPMFSTRCFLPRESRMPSPARFPTRLRRRSRSWRGHL